MQIKLDEGAVQEVYRLLGDIKNGAARVIAPAITRTLQQTRTKAHGRILELYKMPSRDTLQKMKITKPTYTKLSGRISTPWRGSMLTRYPHGMPKRKAPWVEVTPGQREEMPGAFYITFGNGVKAIAFRPGPNSSHETNWGDLYITRGPSVSQALNKVKEESDLEDFASETLLERMEYETTRLLKKLSA